MKLTRTRTMLYMAAVACTLATTQAITRRSSESEQYQGFSGSMLSVVKFDDAGPRKRTVSTTAMPFNHTICIVFDSSYADLQMRITVNRTLKFISSRLCVQFIDVTDIIDKSDSNWGIKHGCQSNAYILITNQTTCNSPVGAMNGDSAVPVSACNGFYIAMHEILHALSSIHVQQDCKAASYMSVFFANIQRSYWDTYKTTESCGDEMDLKSTLMYDPSSWTYNGDVTFLAMREDKIVSYWMSSEKTIFRELNRLYKCNEYECGNAKVNCGKGYYAKVDGACQCVCPDNMDPATKCASFINGPNNNARWPTKGVVWAGEADNKCPSGTGPAGWLSVTGSKLGEDPSPVPFPTNGKDTTYLAYCAVNSPASSDMYDWSVGGDMCFGKDKGVPCGGVFNEFDITYTSYAAVTTNGSCGDISVSGCNTTMRFCCKKEFSEWVLQLPNDKAYRLWTGRVCPNIEGMRSYVYRPSFKIAGATWSANGPYDFYFYNMSYGFYMTLCYYMPPVYGCSQIVSLGIAQRSVTFKTPGFPDARTPNRRCFYYVSSDIAVFLLLRINDYDVYEDDFYLVNRNSEWERSFRLDNSNPISDLVSEWGHISFEYWSSYQKVNNTGVNFTVQTVLAPELCYNSSTRGADYLGTVNVSEYYRPCLNWRDTHDCDESPYDPYDGVQEYYDCNYCRNPGGKLLQPWCFVAKNGSNCEKQYCDACRLQQVVDALSTSSCSQLISGNPSFCSTAVQRFGCAKSCNLIQVTPDCPPSYITFGDRCFYFSSDLKTKSQALQFCSAQGVGGTLLRILSAEENMFLQQYRNDKGCSSNVWIDAKIDTGDNEWLYMRTDTPIVYSNWTAGLAKSYATNTCAALLPTGSWAAFPCMDSTIRHAFACQSQRVATCPSPKLPADGVLVDPAKTFYHEGDRVTIQCKYNLDPVPKQIMCKGGNWTDLQSACSTCPLGWDLYLPGDRCVYYHNVNLTIEDAESLCRSQSPERNSTLFRVQSLEDYCFVGDYQCLVSDSCCCDHLYISGRYRTAYKTFIYTDSTDQVVTYANMTASQMKSCKNNSFVYMYRRDSGSGRGRSENCLTDLSWSAMPLCQMSKLADVSDKYGSCQKALSYNARFCTYPLAAGMCPTSCGVISSPKNCSEPTSSTYLRLSDKATISPGGFMTFTCKPGYFRVGGDTQRACGLNGQLLGQELQCINNPKILDVGLDPIAKRLDTLPSKTCFLIDREEYRVVFAGKISAWYCMTVTAGNITFVVYRRSGSSYTLVGSNTVQCRPRLLWGVYISPESQIAVKQGDLVGAHSVEDDTLQMSLCDDDIDNSFKVLVATVDDTSGLSSAQFFSTSCMRPSMGYRLNRL